MVGAPTHTEVVVLSPNKKERLSGALLRLLEKGTIKRTEENKILVSNKTIALLHFELYTEESKARTNSVQVEPITSKEVEYYLHTYTDYVLDTEKVIDHGPRHTTKILRPTNKRETKSIEHMPGHERILYGKDLAAGEGNNY